MELLCVLYNNSNQEALSGGTFVNPWFFVYERAITKEQPYGLRASIIGVIIGIISITSLIDF